MAPRSDFIKTVKYSVLKPERRFTQKDGSFGDRLAQRGW
jgi:hypothetical protein